MGSWKSRRKGLSDQASRLYSVWMIKSIELINWKTHKHTVMNFQKGVNVLVGVMGAGKSSIIDGISFALFGTFPSLNHKRTTIENLISNRPKAEDSAEIRIKFAIGKDEYTVSRKISKRESTFSRIEKNGSYLQTQTARVNEEVENLIKINYDTFSRAIYAEQNRLNYFLDLTKSDRKRQIDEMLGLDSFAKAEENATSLINQIRSMVSDEEQLMAQIDVRELKAQLEKMTKERQALEEEQKILQNRSREGEQSLLKLQKGLSDLKSKYERSKRISKEIAELSSKIETLKRELKGIDELVRDRTSTESEFAAKSKTLSSLEAELRRLRKEESELVKAFAQAETMLKLNREKEQEREKLMESMKGNKIEEMEKKIREDDAGLQEMISELASLKAKRTEIREWSEELAKHVSKCPLCERELSDEMKKTLLDQKNASLKEADSSIARMEKRLSEIEKGLTDLRKGYEKMKIAGEKLNDYANLDSTIERYSIEAKKSKEMHLEVNAKIEKSSKEMEQLNKIVSDLNVKIDAIKRKEKHEMEIKEASMLMEERGKELKELNTDEKILYSMQEQITKESAQLSDINSKIGGNVRYLQSLESQITEKAKSIASIAAITDRIESRRRQVGEMNKFKGALIETETELRNSLVTAINALMQNIWMELYPYADYTGIRLNAKRDDYALEASIGTDGNGSREWVEIEGIASGGEKSVACLTMRIALAMVIVPNLKWLILDEPTHNIDENGISKLIEVFGNSLPKVVEQIFIITHDNSLKNISSARVFQLDRNKDKNEYTSIVEL